MAGLFWYVYRGFGRWGMPNLSILRPVIDYSVPLGLGGLGMLTIHFGDRFFLSRSCTLTEIGIYSLAYKFGMMLTYLNLPFTMFWRSQVHHIMKDGDAKGEAVYVRMFTFVALFFGFAAYCLVLLAPLIVRSVVGPAFHAAAIFVPWLAAAYLLRVLASQLESGLLVGNKTKWVLVSDWLAAAVCLAGYVFLIPRYGVWGAVVATLLAFLVMFVFTAAVSHHLMPRVFEIRKIAVAYALLTGLLALAWMIPHVEGLAGAAIIVTFIPLALLLLFLLPPLRPEQSLLLGLFRRA
jgi:O-antigen/teichoic acid export membrane protein